MAIEDAMVWPILEDMLSCLNDAFAHHPEPPAIIRHQTGNGNAIAQIDPTRNPRRNECCEGLAWVRLASIFPAAGDTLAPDTRVGNCYRGWAVQVELGAVRCWPGAGKFADKEMWAESAYLVAQDAAALRRTVTCCYEPGNDLHQVAVGTWTPVGITGQCVGGRMPVTVSSDVGDCCDDPDDES